MNLRTTLMAAVASVGLVAAANAAPITAGSSIDLNGYVQANGASTLNMATSLDFVTGSGGAASVGTAGTLSSYSSGTGAFAGITCSTGSCGAIKDIASLAVGAQSITTFLSLTGGSNASAITFNLSNITGINRTNTNFLSFTASGTLTYDGFDPTPGVFFFSAQGNRITSFSGTTLSVATPEPASLAILGGSLAALGLIRRRKA